MSGVMVPAVVAQGWCPSTYRLFEAPDGLLARAKVPGGILTTAQLAVVGEAAAAFGNGVVEITNRANLQLRGIRDEAADGLRSMLVDAGVVAPTEAAEDRRNVLASPTAGLDPSELLDVRPVVRSVVETLDGLDAVLGRDIAALPHKFGVLVDGGGRCTLRGRGLDLTLGAVVLASNGTVVFELGLGASLPELRAENAPVLTVALDDVSSLVTAASWVSASPPGGLGPGRMADLVVALGHDAVVDAVDDAAGHRIVRRSGAELASSSIATVDAPPLGAYEQPSDGRCFVGLIHDRPTLRADAVGELVAVLGDFGRDEVRLTPWRTVVAPDVAAGAVESFVAATASRGWSTDPSVQQVADAAVADVRATVGASR